jgi:3',5'-cyclic AMP phosphodiesterase CpdA
MVELLHISDLHIAKKFRRVNPLDFWAEFRAKRLMKLFRIERRLLGLQTTSDARPLAALVHFLARKRDSAGNHVPTLISGDLSATGSFSDLLEANRLLFQQPSPPTTERLPNQLGLVAGCVLPMPGNHDRYHPASPIPLFQKPYAPACRNFDTVFRDHWNDPFVNSQRLAATATGRPLYVVAGDLSLRSESDASPPNWKSTLGQGYAYPDLCERMARETADIRQRHHGAVDIVWAVHFSPLVTEDDSALRLIKERALIESAHSSYVRHIFCGHTHKPRRIRVLTKRPIDIFVAGTALANIEVTANSFFLHRLANDNGVIRIDTLTYKYRLKKAMFEVSETPRFEEYSQRELLS